MVEVVALLLASVIVPLTGGSLRRLAHLDFEAPWLLFLGLGIQVLVEFTRVIPASRADDVGFALLLGSYVLILTFGILNLRITGMSIVVIGIALNVLVIALNQGMPYVPVAGGTREVSAKHRPERPGDVLTVLDDRIPVPGPLAESASFGDLIIAVGIVDLVFRASRRTRRAPRDLDSLPAPPPPGPSHVDLVAAEAPITPSTPPYEPTGTVERSSTRSSAASTRGSYTYPGPE